MKLDSSQNKLQKLLEFLVFSCILIYTLINFRYGLTVLLDSSYFGIIIEQSLVAILLIVQIYILLTRKFSPYVYLYLLIVFWHISLWLVKGYGARLVWQAISNDGIFLIFIAWLETFEWKRRSVIKVLFFASILHILFILLEYFGFIASSIDKFSLYGDSNPEMGYRYGALFAAPGVLALYSVMVAIYAAADFKISRDYLSISLLVLSLILGLSSGNRSFILATFIGLSIVYFWRPRFSNYKKVSFSYRSLFFTCALTLLIVPFLIFQEELFFLFARFEWEILATDAYTRFYGRAGSIPALQSLLSYDSIFGTTYLDPFTLKDSVSYNGQIITLSNSYSSMLVTRGWLFGSITLSIYLGAILKYRRISKHAKSTDISIIGSCMYFALLGSGIVLFFDNLIYSQIFVVASMLAYSSTFRRCG